MNPELFSLFVCLFFCPIKLQFVFISPSALVRVRQPTIGSSASNPSGRPRNGDCFFFVSLSLYLSLSISLSLPPSLSLPLYFRLIVQELRESLSELAEACLTHLPNLLAKYQVCTPVKYMFAV